VLIICKKYSWSEFIIAISRIVGFIVIAIGIIYRVL
jgi:hypothetical protein